MIIEQPLVVNVPLPLRQIFAQWGEQWDPAPLCCGGAEPQAAALRYQRLAGAGAELAMARRTLAAVYFDAFNNMMFGQFAELRREGAQVFPWIARVVASDPELRAHLG
jgi:hypothetical protein